jgi:uncharacterized protein (TIGR03435 family)
MKISHLIGMTICLLGIFPGKLLATADRNGPQVGDIPPPLVLSKTIQGPPVAELTWEKLKGKVVVLEFWATWCGPCVAAIPHLNDLAEKFKDEPVVFISVTSENEDVVKQFLKRRPMKAAVGLDDYEVLNKVFHVRGIPHTVIVDASGRVAAITHPAEVEPEHLEEILAGKKCSLPPPEIYTIDRTEDNVVTNQAPPLFEISIREHKMPPNIRGPVCTWSADTNTCKFNGKIATVESAFGAVFGKSSSRTFISGKLPEGYYDFKLRAPAGRCSDLRDQFIAALRTTFGIEVKCVTRKMDVYLLTQISTNASGFYPVAEPGGGGQTSGGFRLSGCKMDGIVNYLELALGKPVFDETGLQGLFHVDMKWKLSESEQLLAATDKRVWRAIDANPQGDWIGSLPEELRTGESLGKARRLQTELAKPESEQFRPDPDAVIAAARERLEWQLTPVQRSVEVLEISAEAK